MALVDTTWYANSVAHAAVTARVSGAAVTAGTIRRQFTTPTVGNERCFICIVAGTSAVATDATWVLTRGAKTTDGTVTWMECTGQAALNGDLTNTQTWAAVKAATPAVLGQIIKRSNNASYQICTTAGAMSASEPAFSDTAGVTTTDTTAVWTSLGAVGSYTGGMAPFARLGSVFGPNWFAAGGTVFVSSNHAETQTTAISFSPTMTLATVGRIICHNSSGPYPPTSADLATTAMLSTTAVAPISINCGTGGLYIYGLTLRCGVGQSGSCDVSLNSTSGAYLYVDACSLEHATTATANMKFGGSAASTIILNNTTVKFANTGASILAGAAQIIWQNTGQVLAAGSVVPTGFMELVVGMSNVVLEALDLSQLTGNIFEAGFSSTQGSVSIRDCKLNATGVIGTPTGPMLFVQLARSSA